jgi:hypothetical protein
MRSERLSAKMVATGNLVAQEREGADQAGKLRSVLEATEATDDLQTKVRQLSVPGVASSSDYR